jgi:hypothetical protein
MSTFKIAVVYLYLLWKLRKLIAAILLFDIAIVFIKLIAGLAGKVISF